MVHQLKRVLSMMSFRPIVDKCLRLCVVLSLLVVLVTGCASTPSSSVPEIRRGQSSPYFPATRAAGNCLSQCAQSPSSGDGTFVANCIFLIPACGIGLVIGFTIDIVIFPIIFVDRVADRRRQEAEAEEKATKEGKENELDVQATAPVVSS